jgi:hypothetical protein
LILKIIGGTGRFQDASGVLTYTETSLPVLADAIGNVAFTTEAGEITGTVSGVAIGNQQQDEQQEERG